MKIFSKAVCAALLIAISGFAAPVTYVADLDGPSEDPANASPGVGIAIVTYDSTAHTLQVEAVFNGLLSPTNVAHIHCCTDPPGNIGVASYPTTFPGWPGGSTSDTYSSAPIDLTVNASFTDSFRNNFGGGTAAGAEAALVAGMLAGRAYFNIHSDPLFPGGEIRDFLQVVPEPATGLGVAGVLAALVFVRRRRQA